MRKRILTMVMAVLLCAGLLPVSASAAEFKFIDVSPDAWYYNDVKTAVDTGLVNGKTETTYCPNDFLTYAEAVKLAACMHQKYTTGVVSLVNGDPWYKSYADYAKMNAIISQDYDWNAKATRAGYMAIFAHALPDAALSAKNDVPNGSIPDVPVTHPQAAEIYKLYRAGILEGSADTYYGTWTQHLCKPSDNIQRSEVAAILTRMMFVDSRKTFTMGETKPDAPVITLQPKSVTVDEGQIATFTVKAEGKDLTYQWYYLKPGADSWAEVTVNGKADTYSLTAEARHDGYSYRCTVKNAGGSVNSIAVLLRVNSGDKLAIVKQPESYVLKSLGDKAVFTVTIKGGKAPYIYKWIVDRENSQNSMNDRSEALSSVFVYETDKDSFKGTKYIRVWCEITDAKGETVTTETVEILQTVEDLKIVKDLEPYNLKEGEWEATFSVTVSGGKAPYQYIWRTEAEGSGTDVKYQTDETTCYFKTDNLKYELDQLGLSVNVVCYITDSTGKVVVSKKVPVNPYGKSTGSLQITKQPEDVTCALNDTVTFSVKVEGGKAPYKYVWGYYHKGNGPRGFGDSVNGKPDLTLKIDSEMYFEMDIFCRITDAEGTEVDSKFVYVKNKKTDDSLKIIAQPVNAVVPTLEGSAYFGIVVSGGTKPYTYTWMYVYNGKTGMVAAPLNGNPTLTVAMEGPENYEMEFYCVVTDADGSEVTSKTVKITKS